MQLTEDEQEWKQMGILEVLGLIFIVGKLTGMMTWPWVVVLLPFIVFLVINFLAFLFTAR